MPLTPFQQAVAKLMAANRSPSSHLAGGAAIHLLPGSPRTSNDLDYFHDEETLVAQAFAEDRWDQARLDPGDCGARKLVKTLPPEEAGCLYFDATKGKFVTPEDNLPGLLRHRGVRGGILPLVGESPAISSDPASKRLLAAKHPSGLS